MPITVSLEKLVAIAGTRLLWPDEFAELVAKLEDNPDDRGQWAAVADWCEENNEPGLALGFQYVAKRPGIKVSKTSGAPPPWWLSNLPKVLDGKYPEGKWDVTTLAGLASELVAKINLARAELE